MNIDLNININKFAQDLISLNDIKLYFEQLRGISEKRNFLTELSNLILQNKVDNSDIDEAIFQGGLKHSFTPCVLIQKGVKYNVLQDIINLPDSELNKTLILFLSLFKVGYRKRLKQEQDSNNKWWYQDLSDNKYVDRIKTLSKVKIITKRLLDQNHKEIGVILTAFPPFALNLNEKNLIERQLELYAFNTIFPGQGLIIYREMNIDVAGLVIICDINQMPVFKEFTLSLY